MSNGTPAILPRAPLSAEDALGAIQAKIAEKGGQDSFRVKVFRRVSIGAPQSHVATLDNATMEHFANPETWLPMLAGGGPIYVLAVTHSTDQIPVVSFQPPNINGAPRDVDPRITQNPEWKGPATLLFPSTAGEKPKTVTDEVKGLFSVFAGLPGAPGSAESSARGQGSMPGTGGAGPSSEVLQLRMEHGFEALARAMEAQQKASERQIAMLVEALKTSREPAPPTKPPISLVEIATLVTAVGAVVTPLLQTRAQREAEDRKLDAEARARAEARETEQRGEVMKMLGTMNERASSASSDTMKVIAPMVDAVSQMGRTVLQQVATMRELTSGEQQPPEDGLLGLAKAGLAAFAEVMAARAANPQPPQLPPAQRPPVQTPPKNTQTPPVDAEEEDAEDAEQAEYLRTADPDEILKAIEDAIRKDHDAEELADSFLDAMAVNEGVKKKIAEAGGVLPFFRSRLGDEWIAQHMNYVQKIIATLTNEARKRGMN